jgi:modulator of FtsH protease
LAAYDASQWSDLFVATAGASAALAGLVFVAVSINIERILKAEELPPRAQMTLLLLLSVLLVSIIGLIPGQSRTALGAELLGVGLVFGAAIAVLSKRGISKKAVLPGWVLLSRQLLTVAGTVPFVIGAVSILAEAGGGLYWTVGGMVFAIMAGVGNAWALLVEILR